MATVVFFHAHPDDEAIATGGTMASLSDAGHRVVLVTATGGELGEVPDGLLNQGETLAERRRTELAEASRILGVERQVYLGYLDSGMAGEATNDRPGSFAAADVEEAAGALARLLDEEDAAVVVTYDEHGGYGHPDHVQVHRVGMRAAELAATPGVYMATMNRDFMRDLAVEVATSEEWDTPEDWDGPGGQAEGMESMGEPASRITTEIAVRPWIERKREAMRAHASQISETSFFLAMPDDVFARVWGQEWYIRVWPVRNAPEGSAKETALVLGGGTPAGGADDPARVGAAEP